MRTSEAIEKRIEIEKAIQAWKNTMKQAYPNIDLNKWNSNNAYRFEHPQPKFKSDSKKLKNNEKENC